MAIIHLKGLIVSILLVLFFTTIPIATLVSVTTLTLTGTHLSSFAIFTLLLAFAILRETFCYNLSLAMQIASDGKVALDRIQMFLTEKVTKPEGIGENHSQNRPLQQNLNLQDNLLVKNCKGNKQTKMAVQLASYKTRDEVQTDTSHNPSEPFADQMTVELSSSNSIIQEPYVSVSEASCSWNHDNSGGTLKDITFSVSSGGLLAITGAVGSGKSSLLTAILGELPLRTGAISYQGKLAYVPQIPWVFSGTIRENILFGLPFNEDRFQNVVHICDLTKDLTNFTSGDLTEIGQRGVTLSGGQKARVGLARAVYSDADIYLLDDPLSAVDTKVGRKLFESCILGHLSGRIRLLVTHQLQYLKDVDRVLVMKDGSIIHQGVYAEVLDQGALVGVEELSEPYDDGPGFAESVSLEDEFTGKEITKGELEGPSISSVSLVSGHVEEKAEDAFADGIKLPVHLRQDEEVGVQWLNDEKILKIDSSSTLANTSDMPEADKQQNNDLTLAEPFEIGPGLPTIATPNELGDKGSIIDKLQHDPFVSMDLRVKRLAEGEDNDAFVEEDNDTFSLNVQKNASVGQELSESIENDTGVVESVIVDVFNDKGITTEGLHEPSISSVSFMGGQSEGKDNEAFVEDSTPSKQENESDVVNVIDETAQQITSVPAAPNMCDVSKADAHRRSSDDLKEDEETKSAGTVTWRLYWDYFKQGLPVSRIMLLAVVLLFAQGKANS